MTRVIHGVAWTLLALLAPVGAFALFDGFHVVVGPRGQAPCPVDAALVMGAAQYDGRPSPVFESRLAVAVDLVRRGCVATVVVSGGAREGDRTSEGEAGAAWLIAHGVPAEIVVAETRATTSVENVRFGLAAVPDAVTWTVVTDDVHAWRSRYLMHRFGVDAEASFGDAGRRDVASWWHEVGAMAVYRWWGLR